MREKYPEDVFETHLIYCTQLAHEVHELMDCCPWKPHRKGSMRYDREHLKEEMVDVLKFLMGLALLHEFTIDELLLAHAKKHATVVDRIKENTDG